LRAGLFPRFKRDDRNFLPLSVIRPERAAINGETGLLSALEGAFAAGGIQIARADLRAVIQAGAIKLKPLLQTLANKATPMAANGGANPRPPTLILSIDQGEELFSAEAQTEAKPFLVLLRELINADEPAIIAVFDPLGQLRDTSTRPRTGRRASGHAQPAADAEGLLCGSGQLSAAR
jgi:hypothetical protein